MSAGQSTVTVKILGNAKELEASMSSMEASVGASMSRVKAHAETGGVAIAGAGAKAEESGGKLSALNGSAAHMVEAFGAMEIGKSVVENFDNLENATNSLNASMAAAGEVQGPKFAEALSNAQHAGEGLGFSAAEVTGSLQQMRLAGVDMNHAMGAQQTIMDLARAKHISLADATDAVTKAMQGNGKALKDLNVELPAHLATTQALDTANQNLAKAKDAVNVADAKQAQAAEKSGAAFKAYSQAVEQYGEGSKQAQAKEAQYQSAVNATQAAVRGAEAAHQKLTDAQAKQAQAAADVGDRTHNLGDVLQIVAGKTDGAAASAADTLSGRLGVMKESMMDASTKLLTGLQPAMSKLVDVLGYLADHMNVVIPVMGALLAAFIGWQIVGVVTTAIEGVTAAIEFLGTTLDFLAANPIVLVIVGIVAALALLQAHFHFIEPIVRALGPVFQKIGEIAGNVFSAIGKVVGDVVGVISSVLSPLGDILSGPFRFWLSIVGTEIGIIVDIIKVAIGVIGAVIGAIVTVVSAVFNALAPIVGPILKFIVGLFAAEFSVVASIIGGIIGIVSSVIGTIGGIVGTLSGVIGGIFQGIHDTVAGIWNAMANVIKAPINTVIAAINGMIALLDQVQIHVHGPSWLGSPGFDWNGLGMGFIPSLATGSDWLTVPMIARVGDNSRGERVQTRDMQDRETDAIVSRIAALIHRSGDIHSTVNVRTDADPFEISKEVAWQLRTRGAY